MENTRMQFQHFFHRPQFGQPAQFPAKIYDDDIQDCLNLEKLSILSQKKIVSGKVSSQEPKKINEIASQNVEEIVKLVMKFKEAKEADMQKLIAKLEDLKRCVQALKIEGDDLLKQNKKVVDENVTLKRSIERLSELVKLQRRCDSLIKEFEWMIETVEKTTCELNELKQLIDHVNQQKENLENQVEYYENRLSEFESKYAEDLKNLVEMLQNKEQEFELTKDHLKEMQTKKEELEKKLTNVKNEYGENIKQLQDSLQLKQHHDIKIKQDVETLRAKNEEFISKIIEQVEKLQSDVVANYVPKIDQMKKNIDRLESILADLRQDFGLQNETMNHLNQTLKDEQAKTAKISQKFCKLETENFISTEDLKKLYFRVNYLKAKASNLETKKFGLMSEYEKEKEKNLLLQESMKNILNKNDEIIHKNQMLGESNSDWIFELEQLTALIKSKDVAYANAVKEKDQLIHELKQQNMETLQRIRSRQIENDKMFRNLHDLIRNSFKQPAEISSVAAEQKSKEYSPVTANLDLKSSPGKLTTTITMVPETPPSPPKCISPAVTKESPIGSKIPKSILRSSAKRKLSFDDKNKSVKKVHFSEVFPTAKQKDTNDQGEDNEDIDASKTTISRSSLSRWTKGIDMSFVKRKLDEKYNNKKYGLDEAKKSDSLWVDDIVSF